MGNCSKAYISQVKHGKRPSSQKLLDALLDKDRRNIPDYVSLFLQSREAMNCSPGTLRLYRFVMERFHSKVSLKKAKASVIECYLLGIPSRGVSLGNRHAHYRVLKTFFRWLESEYDIQSAMRNVRPPILPKLILPSLSRDQVRTLIDKSGNSRDRAIIALATESGLRVAELAAVKVEDIDWGTRTVKILGKGRKESYAPFGTLSEQYLKDWISRYNPSGNIWGISKSGIQMMLRRLEQETGLPCNPHTFRRTFACLLRKAGVDTLTIKDLGRWESVDMVERYTRSVCFHDSLRFYKGPLS